MRFILQIIYVPRALEGIQEQRKKNSSRESKAGILDKITFELGLKG